MAAQWSHSRLARSLAEYPEQREGQPPTSKIKIDNVNRELVPEIRAALGVREYIQILPHAHHQPFELNADGTLSPMTAGSTQAVSTIVHHAGIARTSRFTFKAPF